jgi:hypothetical protein
LRIILLVRPNAAASLQGIAEQVGKNRVDGLAAQMRDAEKMMALLGYPVRRMDQQNVRLECIQALARPLVRPAQLLPPPFGTRLVLRWIFTVNEMWRMGREKSGDDLAHSHGCSLPKKCWPLSLSETRPSQHTSGSRNDCVVVGSGTISDDPVSARREEARP